MNLNLSDVRKGIIMKKIIALVLILVMCLISLASCNIWVGMQEPDMVAENSFFAEEYLSECKLSDMPVPDVENSMRTDDTIYLNLTDEEFDNYIRTLYDYLLTKDDVYFKGIWNDISNPGGIFYLVSDSYIPLGPVTENFFFASDSFDFAFSRSEALSKNGYYVDPVNIMFKKISGTLEKENFTYNVWMKISNAPRSCFYNSEWGE